MNSAKLLIVLVAWWSTHDFVTFPNFAITPANYFIQQVSTTLILYRSQGRVIWLPFSVVHFGEQKFTLISEQVFAYTINQRRCPVTLSRIERAKRLHCLGHVEKVVFFERQRWVIKLHGGTIVSDEERLVRYSKDTLFWMLCKLSFNFEKVLCAPSLVNSAVT